MKAAIIPVTPLAQNCTIIWNEDTMTGAAIDVGGDVDRIIPALEQQGITLEKIFLTHAHLDHAGGATEMAEKLNIPIEGPHKDDKFLADSIPEQGRSFGMNGRAVTPDRWLEDGDTVTVAGLEFLVRHCPGHTPGHVIFFHEPSKLAQVGDVLFKGSIGRTDFPRGNHAQLIDSITHKLWPLGDDVTFIPGHGETSTFGYERKTNPFVADAVLKQ